VVIWFSSAQPWINHDSVPGIYARAPKVAVTGPTNLKNKPKKRVVYNKFQVAVSRFCAELVNGFGNFRQFRVLVNTLLQTDSFLTIFCFVKPMETRNSAIADKACDAFRGQARSPNMDVVSYKCAIAILSVRRTVFDIFDFKSAMTLKTGLKVREDH